MRESDVRAAIDEAVACFNAGDFARAEEIYRLVVSKAPNATRCSDLGVILHAQAKHDEAIGFLSQAIRLEPRSADHHGKLGHVLLDAGKTADALQCLAQAIELDPRHSGAWNTLGCLHLGRDDHDKAATCFQRALSVNPRNPEAHNNLGLALRKAGKVDEGMACHRQAIALDPAHAGAHTNLGTAHYELDQLDEAILQHQKAIALKPAYADAHYNLANSYLGALRLDEAITSFERALALNPKNASYRWNYSNALLLAGDFAKGWEEYESRWRGSDLKGKKPAYGGPEWTGEDIAGRTLLTYAEQGFGDAIQFIRYAALLAKRGVKVLYACQPELVRLFSRAVGVSQVIPLGQPLPRFDVHVPLLSLPRLFHTNMDTIPSGAPYLRADPALVEAWRKRAGMRGALRVGLIWGGRITHRLERQRSCALSDFAPLTRVPGIQFYSLQKGPQAEQAKSPPAGMTLVDWTSDLGDFADTAALMENLDLIISVDTAAAHLAGALGRPVWLLNRYQTEWRWLLDREDSPWYPTLRIFRQPTIGDWASVMQRASEELTKLAHPKM